MSLEETHQELHRRGEVIKFLLLVAVLFIVVLVVALSRPLIFEQIVPAVMGWNGEESAPSALPAPTSEPTQPMPTATSPGAVQPAAEPSASPTARPTPVVQTHTVEPGDTLTEIARRYGVTSQAIIEANNLSDPNVIRPGDQLVIPTD